MGPNENGGDTWAVVIRDKATGAKAFRDSYADISRHGVAITWLSTGLLISEAEPMDDCRVRTSTQASGQRMGSVWHHNAQLLLLVLILVVSGCDPGPHVSREVPDTPAAKTTTNPVRHELEPLTKRFPALGSPVSASWVSGDMGDSRVPGPSLYWIDAIVEVTPATANGLKTTYLPVPTSNVPDIWESLRGNLPQGGYLASDQLEQAFRSTKINAHAYLAVGAPVVVITATGE